MCPRIKAFLCASSAIPLCLLGKVATIPVTSSPGGINRPVTPASGLPASRMPRLPGSAAAGSAPGHRHRGALRNQTPLVGSRRTARGDIGEAVPRRSMSDASSLTITRLHDDDRASARRHVDEC